MVDAPSAPVPATPRPAPAHCTQARPGAVALLLIASTALFITGLDNLVVTVALPTIRKTLQVSVSDLSWTVNAYTITFAVFILGAADVGNRFGPRNSFVVGTLVFTLASATVALSSGVVAFGIARGFQGIGAALLVPLAFTLVGMYASDARRAIYLGVLGGISGLAVALGPFISGLVVAASTWQMFFG